MAPIGRDGLAHEAERIARAMNACDYAAGMVGMRLVHPESHPEG